MASTSSSLSHHLCSVPGSRRTHSSNLHLGTNCGHLHTKIPQGCPWDCPAFPWVHQTRESEPYHLQLDLIMMSSFPLLPENQSLVNRKSVPTSWGAVLDSSPEQKKPKWSKTMKATTDLSPMELGPTSVKPSWTKGGDAQRSHKEWIKLGQFSRWEALL